MSNIRGATRFKEVLGVTCHVYVKVMVHHDFPPNDCLKYAGYESDVPWGVGGG